MEKLNLMQKKLPEGNFFFFNDKYFFILKDILDMKYNVIQEFKNDKRTYVAKIKINEKYYILKKVYNNKKLKKFLTIFKKGESLSTFLSVNEIKNKGLEELVDVLGAVVKRRNGMIINELFIMEYCEGRKILGDKELLKVFPVLNKIYSFGRFHGDCNPGNFLLTENGKVKILDTKLKKMFFGDYRKHYDSLTLMKHLKNPIQYPYKKNIFYYIAYLVRKFRDIKN